MICQKSTDLKSPSKKKKRIGNVNGMNWSGSWPGVVKFGADRNYQRMRNIEKKGGRNDDCASV